MENRERADRLGSEDLRRLFWRLSVPAILSQLVTLIYNIVDRIYIGHIPSVGGMALTGLGVCTPLTLLMSAFAMLICAGGGPMVAVYLGEKKKQDAETVIRQSFLLLMLTGVLLMAVMYTQSETLLRAFGASDATIPYALAYFRWYVGGTLFMLTSTGMVTFIIAQGDTRVSMISIITGAVTNIILDPIMIWVLNMGIAGAALATILSQLISAGLVLHYLCGPKPTAALRFRGSLGTLSMLGQSLALGLSPFIMQITESALSVVFNRSLLLLGGDTAVGAMALFTSIKSMVFLPIQGMCQGAQSITSYNYGAGKLDRVSANVHRLIRCCAFYSLISWILVHLFPRFLLGIFTADATILDYACSRIHIFFAMQVVFGFQVACQQSFLALKNARTSLFLALFRKVILLIPLILILPAFIQPGDAAVFMAEPIADTIAAVVTTATFFHKYRAMLFSRKVQA